MSTTLMLGLTEQGRITSSPATANTGSAGTSNCSVTRERAVLNYTSSRFLPYSVVPDKQYCSKVYYSQ